MSWGVRILRVNTEIIQFISHRATLVLVFVNAFIFELQIKRNIDDIQEKPESQNITYQWLQEEEQTNHDRQYTTTNQRIAEQLGPPSLLQGDHNARLSKHKNKTASMAQLFKASLV